MTHAADLEPTIDEAILMGALDPTISELLPPDCGNLTRLELARAADPTGERRLTAAAVAIYGGVFGDDWKREATEIAITELESEA